MKYKNVLLLFIESLLTAIFERFTGKEAFVYSSKCQTLGVSPAKLGVYPIKLFPSIFQSVVFPVWRGPVSRIIFLFTSSLIYFVMYHSVKTILRPTPK